MRSWRSALAERLVRLSGMKKKFVDEKTLLAVKGSSLWHSWFTLYCSCETGYIQCNPIDD